MVGKNGLVVIVIGSQKRNQMIENELKYVLRKGLYEEVVMDAWPCLVGVPHRRLVQVYLDGGGRVRMSMGDALKAPLYEFNYKQDLPNGEMEEFEIEITKEVFERVRPTGVVTLAKTRYTIEGVDPSKELWDIDFFFHPDTWEVYFAMAECEMATGVDQPSELPPVIRDNLIYAVPREDTVYYTSKKLANPETAEMRMEMLDAV